MNKDEIARKWRRLDPVPFDEIGKACNMVHEAIQLIASTGISYVQKRQDDSHTNCEWSRSLKSFVGNVFGEKNDICLGLNIADLKLLLLKENWTIIEEFNLNCKSLGEILTWMKNNYECFGLNFDQFTLDKHYDIPAKYVLEGGKFNIENKQAFQELSDYYANADMVLRSYKSDLTNTTPVRCWPHHFDIATLLNIGQEKLQSIGIGFSPGDNKNPEPYYYITMWPYPDLEKVSLPDISIGKWNIEGWIGTSLSASAIIKNTDEQTQSRMVLDFIEDSVSAIKYAIMQKK